jgi:dipeptidase E
MRLFLSSENLGNYPEVFLSMVGSGNKLAVIENAKDDMPPEERQAKVNEHLEQLRGQGFQSEELDLRDYFGKYEQLSKKMQEYGGVFAFGGNTFILRRACAYSGFDIILPKLVAEDRVAYGGSSAGPILITPSLRGSEVGDYPENIPEGYKSEIIWDGLNIVPFYIVPHYKSDWWGKPAGQMIEYLESKNLDYYALEDGQVLIVEGERVELLK